MIERFSRRRFLCTASAMLVANLAVHPVRATPVASPDIREYETASGNLLTWSELWKLDNRSGFDKERGSDFGALRFGDSAVYFNELVDISADPQSTLTNGLVYSVDVLQVQVLEIGEREGLHYAVYLEPNDELGMLGDYQVLFRATNKHVIGFRLEAPLDDVETAFRAVAGGIDFQGASPFAGSDIPAVIALLTR